MMNQAQIDAAFADFDPQHNFYQAVLSLLDECVTSEQDAVTMPNLTDAARHFNAGRLAFAKDARAMITDRTRAAIVERVRKSQEAARG